MSQSPIVKPIFLIVTGRACNSGCIMCSIRYEGVSTIDGSTDQILKDMIRGKKENNDRIEFTGGEPTVRKDIVFLIEQAKKLKYKEIGINSNGILFENVQFCDKLIRAGLTHVTFSLHSHNEKLNKLITRSSHSFEKTIIGIKNALHLKLNVSVTTVILKSNYLYIFEIGKLLYKLGVYFWNITDLLPDGLALEKYKKLCVERLLVSEALFRLVPIVNKFNNISFYAFSPCLVHPDLLNQEGTAIITASQKFDVEKPVGYNRTKSSQLLTGENYTNVRLKHVQICSNCKFSNKCPGIWIEYLRLYGDKEIHQLAVKYKYASVSSL